MPRDESIPHLERYLETEPWHQAVEKLSDLDLVNFTNGLLRPTRESYETKEYFHIIQGLFTEDTKSDGVLRIPHHTVRAIQDYTDHRIHT